MRTVIASDLVNRSLDQIWYLTDINKTEIVFEDGKTVATGRSIIYSWFFWEYHRQIEGLKLLKIHLVEQKKMTGGTHSEFLEQVMWTVYEQCKDRVKVQLLKEIAYEITNEIFNKLTVNLEEYVTSSCMLDYIEIMEDKNIEKMIEETPKNGAALVKTKNDIREYLKRPDIYRTNALKAICEADLVNWGQLLQAIAYRGYTTDMDNYFFPNPVMKAYAHGIGKLHDSLLESTSSTKSLIAQDDALKQTEFFNKRIQLISTVIRRLIPKDCGSTIYNRIRITGDGNGVKGNFKSLKGKYYLDDDGKLKVIGKKDKHLIGRLLKIRSVMNCKYRHTCNVCATCYGDLSLNVPHGCNLGYFSAVAFCEILSQDVLSTKHHDNAATIDMIYIEPMVRQVFDIRDKNQDLVLKEVFRDPKKRVTIVVSPVYNGDKSQLNYLEDLELIDEIENYTVIRKSNVRAFTITVEDDETGIPILAPTTLTLGNGSDGAYLSREMLEFIKEKGWAVTAKGDYEFDLKNFPKDKPIFTLPKKHMNTLEFKNLVSKFIESAGTSKHRDGERLINFNKVENKTEQAINRFLEIVNEKVTVNIAHLELFILVFMAKDPARSDARIPKINESFKFVSASSAFNMRSMGPVMPFKDQFPWLTRIESYDGSTKVSSPFDEIMDPEIFNVF